VILYYIESIYTLPLAASNTIQEARRYMCIITRNLLQMNSLTRRKNTKVLPTRWTKPSLNSQASKLFKQTLLLPLYLWATRISSAQKLCDSLRTFGDIYSLSTMCHASTRTELTDLKIHPLFDYCLRGPFTTSAIC